MIIVVEYGTGIDEAEALLMEVANQEPLVVKSPEARVRFRQFGASSLDFELLFWIDNPELRGRSRHKLNSAVYKSFNKADIEIPYAKQDLYIKELPK